MVDPIEIVLSFLGLHAAPGKFSNTNHMNAGLLHEIEIGVPARFRPLFGIPGRAQKDWGRGRNCRLRGDAWSESDKHQKDAEGGWNADGPTARGMIHDNSSRTGTRDISLPDLKSR